MAPKPPPRAPKASPRLDFHWFLVDFGRFLDDFLHHVGYFLSGLRVGGIGRQASTIIWMSRNNIIFSKSNESLNLWIFETLKLWNFEIVNLWNFETWRCDFWCLKMMNSWNDEKSKTRNLLTLILPAEFLEKVGYEFSFDKKTWKDFVVKRTNFSIFGQCNPYHQSTYRFPPLHPISARTKRTITPELK